MILELNFYPNATESSLGTYYKTQPNNLNQSKAHYSTNVTDPDNKTKSNDNKVHSLYLNNENNDQPNKLDIEKPKMSIIKNSMSKIQTNRVSNLSKKIDSVNLNTSYKSKDQSPNKTNNVQNQSYSNIKLNKYSSANFSVTDKYNNDYDSRIELMKKENLKSKLKQLQEEDRRTKAFRYIISKKEREQYMKTKEKIRKIKAKETMQVKNYNLLIKENVEILKEKINEENKQKRIIVQSKDEIIKKAIEQYLEKKQEFINHMCLQDLKKQRIIFKQIKNNTTAENKSY